jgi:protein-tyrosine-phosphatase
MTLESFNAMKSMANRFERVSDQARNIAVETLYFCTGRYAKHVNTDTFHILFVDDQGSGRALLAEALADRMAEPRFRFTGASLHPAAMEAPTAEFLQHRGIDPTRLVPRAVDQVPSLDRFHVVVFLSAAARRGFPASQRKSVFLEWFVDDPSKTPGSPEAVREAHERVAGALEGHLRDLIGAILGADQLKLHIEGA